jgi:hypothetical protein
MINEKVSARHTEIDLNDYAELLYSLRDKKIDKLPDGEIITGEHRNGCGPCTLSRSVTESGCRYFLIKPHAKCDTVTCIGVEWCSVTGSRHTASRVLLDHAQENENVY